MFISGEFVGGGSLVIPVVHDDTCAACSDTCGTLIATIFVMLVGKIRNMNGENSVCDRASSSPFNIDSEIN